MDRHHPGMADLLPIASCQHDRRPSFSALPAIARPITPPRTAMIGRPPSAGGGQFWLVLAGDAAVAGGAPLPANSCIFVGPEEPPFAGASGRVGAELLCLQFRRRARD